MFREKKKKIPKMHCGSNNNPRMLPFASCFFFANCAAKRFAADLSTARRREQLRRWHSRPGQKDEILRLHFRITFNGQGEHSYHKERKPWQVAALWFAPVFGSL